MYSLHYRVDDANLGDDRDLNLTVMLHGENLNDYEREKVKRFISREVNPKEIYEIYQILVLKTGSILKDLSFTRMENDSDLLELMMSTEFMIKISDKCKDIYIENILMIHSEPVNIPGAPNQNKTTNIGLGLIWDGAKSE